MQNFLLGWSIASTIIAIFAIWLLFKKPTTHNEVDRLRQTSKRIRGSNIDNDISATIETKPKKEKKGVFKQFKNKRITKKKEKLC